MSNTNIDPKNSSNSTGNSQAWTPAMFQTHGLPAPAGTNDNGEPFWVINDQQVSWAQMQQYIWQARQQAITTSSGGRGFEQMPSMPNLNFEFPTNTESAPEKGPQSPEKAVEKSAEASIETAVESPEKQANNIQTPIPQQDEEEKAEPAFGDTVPLSTKQTPKAMIEYTKKTTGTNPVKSGSYLHYMYIKALQRILAGIGA